MGMDGNAEEDRRWFQTKKERNEEKQKLKKKLKDPTFTKSKEKKLFAKKLKELDFDPAEAKMAKKLNDEADFVERQAKRKRKLTKIRSVDDDIAAPAAKKFKKKSSFESELVNTSEKSVKA